MKKIITLVTGIVCCTFAYAQNDEARIRAILDQQIIAWNKGNLDTFMQGYWNDDSLMFVGKTGVTYGYNNTLDRYRKNYSDKDAMGELSFDILHVNKIDDEYYLVIGKYTLRRKADKPEGHFTVLFKKMSGEWKIILDHSS